MQQRKITRLRARDFTLLHSFVNLLPTLFLRGWDALREMEEVAWVVDSLNLLQA